MIELDASTHEALWMSERAREILGWDQPILVTAAQYQREIVHPDDRASHSQALVAAMRGGSPLEQVIRIRRHGDGQCRWIKAHGELVRGQHSHPPVFVVVMSDVTDARRAQELRDDQARRLRVALQAGRMGVWELDLESGRQHWNAAQFALMDMAPEGGAPDLETFFACIHPDDRTRMRSMLERVVRDGGGFETEFRIRRTPDGEQRWLAVAGDATPAGPGKAARLVGVNINVTERKRVEQDLVAQRERLAMALDAGRMGVWELDLATGLRHWTPGMFGLTGVDPAAGTPQHEAFYGLVEPEDREALRAAMAGLGPQNPRVSIQFRVRHAGDGSMRWIVSQGQWMLDPATGRAKAVGLCMDVTERVLTERRLLEADERKDEFLATLAHELRNPLAPLRNVASLLRRSALTPVQQPLVDIMERQVGQLRRLVEDLLEVSRISQGKITLRREAISVSAAIYTALEAAQPLIERRRQVLEVRLRSSASVLADAVRLSQVVTNLLTNASKFTPEAGVIALSTSDDDGCVLIEVRDTGIGIPADLLPRVFDLFIQGAATTGDQAQSGLGIGLSLVKRLVEMHGGSVRAASEGPNRGACFTVRLPRGTEVAPPDRRR